MSTTPAAAVGIPTADNRKSLTAGPVPPTSMFSRYGIAI